MTTVARPYATAAFEYALAQKKVADWDAMLEAAALLTRETAVQALLMNPCVTSKQLSDFYCDVLTRVLDKERTHFIYLLAEYRRLKALPEIARLFKLYRAAQERKLTVQIISAVDLSDRYQQTLKEVLAKRLDRQVTLECSVDKNLIGGAVIKAGDTVIDGSVRSTLDRMIEFIS